jgi:VanZ family protein
MADGKLTDFLTRYDPQLRSLCRLIFALSVVTVLVLSLLPGPYMPHFRLSDKICHFIAYCETAASGWLAYRLAPGLKFVLPGLIALGGAIELAQHYVPGRSTDILDFTANSLGVLAGYGLARMVETVWRVPAGATRP